MNKKLEYISCVLGLIAFNFLLVNDFFKKSNLYNSDPIYFIDHMNILCVCILISTVMIGFHQTYGLNIYSWCGLVYFHIAPLGITIIISLISYLGLEIAVAYKIALFFFMIFEGIFPFFLIERVTHSKICGLLGSLWPWIDTLDKFWLRRFAYGAYSFQIAAIFLIIFFYFNSKINFEDKKERLLDKSTLSLTLILAIIAYIHYFAAILLGFIIVEQIVFEFISKKKITETLRNKIKSYFIIAVGAILLNAFWLFPMIFINIPTISFNEYPNILTVEFSIPFLFYYIRGNWLWLVMINIMIFWLYPSYKTNSFFSILILIFYNALIFAFILPFTNIIFFSGNNAFRYLILAEIISAILFGIFLYNIYTKFENIIRRIKNGLKWKSSLVIPLSMCLISLISLMPFKFNNFYIENNSLHPEEQYLSNWIQTNTTKSSRILFQNPPDYDTLNTTETYYSTYLAVTADRFIASGFSEDIPVKDAINVRYIGDNLFTRDITSYNITELEYYFLLYNIEYIIVSQGESIKFFDNLSTNSNDFHKMENTTVYHYYQYLNASRSFIISNLSFEIKDFSINSSKITFSLLNSSQNNDFIISLHDYVNWHVYINNKPVTKITNPLGLIQFKLPPDLKFPSNIEIKWEKLPIEYMFDWISISSGIIFIISIIKLKKIK